MLAATLKPENINTLRYPILVSRKIDGIRCLVVNGEALSRTLKPIPNAHIRNTLKEVFKGLPPDVMLDGELISGSGFQQSTSNIMTRDGSPDFVYCLFDAVSLDSITVPFSDRQEFLASIVSKIDSPNIRVLDQIQISSSDELEEIENQFLQEGEEGVMIRSPKSPYKFGRATEREGWLLKLKRFSSCEASVIGFEQKFRNMNEATVNELGLTERSTHKENQVPLEELGALVVKTEDGLVFSVGSGYTQAQREELWKRKDALVGKVVTVKYFDFNIKDKPRFPVFAGFRHPEDM
jgi:DNA ligase-1